MAAAGLSDANLKHFSETSPSCSASVESFKKRRDELLQALYLARGAARYEKDPQVAVGYIEKAKASAGAARADLLDLAMAAGVELSRAKRAIDIDPRDEQRLAFTPQAASPARVEGRMTF